jgi:2,5-furandicarboxylate decarboxylase 1
VIGVDPIILLASQAILPFGVDELEVANALSSDRNLELARCITVNIEVPVSSEIVIEGVISPADERSEGPFGEFPKYYSPKANSPVLHPTAICYRTHPIFYTVLPASREHLLIGAVAREASLFHDIQKAVPRVRQVHLTYGGSCRYHLVISIEKKYEGEPRTAMLAAMSNHVDIKHVVVVDSDVDAFKMEQVEWAIATRFQADRDVLIIPHTCVSKLDPSSDQGIGSKMGLDATAPLGSLEGRFKPISIPNVFL